MIVKNLSEIENYNKILIIGREDSSIVQYVLEPIKKSFDSRIHLNINDNTSFKNTVEKIKYKPFFNDKWLVSYNNTENKAPIRSQLDKLFETTNKNYSCIAYISYKSYRFISKKLKWLMKSDIAVVNLTYMPYTFYKDVTLSNLKVRITNEALSLFLKYISLDYQNIFHHIKTLNTAKGIITSDKVKELIEDTRVVRVPDYLEVLIACKERQSIKILAELLNTYKFKTLKSNLESDIRTMVDLKTLMYKGLLLPYTIYDDTKALKTNKKLPDSLSKISYKKLKTYSELALNIPLKELIMIEYILISARDQTHLILLTMLVANRNVWDKEDMKYVRDILERSSYENYGQHAKSY